MCVCVCVCSQTPGRPSIKVDIDEVEYLRSLRFSWTKIASLLGISRSTLYRRLESEGLSQDLTFSNLTDTELDEKIVAIKQLHPNDGERMMIGHLLSSGIIVQRSRVRASIHRVDPINTALRRSVTVCGRHVGREGGREEMEDLNAKGKNNIYLEVVYNDGVVAFEVVGPG